MKKEWTILKQCLLLEESLCHKATKKAIKDNLLERAVEYRHNLETIQWVLEEMENIEEKGEVL